MSHRELRQSVAKLRSLVSAVEARIDESGVRPEMAQDASGRYILLDAYAALVAGLSALESSR